ncbi:MAG: hypothetical protein CR982_07650 [Candidatus Cloacimonadota bacterium]|nr:MAG: hypothetical protein CR982_07650 [Candidatus Cloacimonadota bacterium]PIE78271.1 MAG: hypothetical protein CSA15_08890 [Candidatus Delongbacteria bacterium]
MKFPIVLILIFSTLLYSNVYEVVDSFNKKNYQGVIEKTISIPDPGSETAGYYFLYRGIALYNLEKYSFSIKTLEQFISVYGDRADTDLALQYLAMSYYKLENSVKAVDILDKLTYSKDKNISNTSMELAKKIIETKSTSHDLKKLLSKVTNKKLYKSIKKEMKSLDLLVVLPLSGENSSGGNDLLRGMNLYIEKNKGKFKKKIKLDVINSESSMVNMVKKVTKKVENGKYDLVVGELTSKFSGALAGITSAYKIPLLIPVASQKILSEISENIYQLSSSSYTISQKVAAYAIDSLKYKTFAILSPMSSEGKEASDGFITKVQEKGGDIISQEWYFDSTKLSRQLKRIRENVLILDSLDIQDYMEADSIKTIPANGIDAFFIPIDFEEIQNVTSQFAFYNFNSKLLGTFGWNDERELYKVRTLIDSLVFGDESSYSTNNLEYREFTEDYREKYDLAPSRLAIKGYDILRLIHRELLKSEDIKSALKDLESYEGISGRLEWNGNRTNQNVELFKYSRSKGIKKIEYTETPLDSLAPLDSLNILNTDSLSIPK